MTKHALWGAAALGCLLAVSARAQTGPQPGQPQSYTTCFNLPFAPQSNVSGCLPGSVLEDFDPAVGYPHPNSASNPAFVAVVSGGGGGGGGSGGTVTQGPQASAAAGNTWFTQDVVLDGLVSGGKLPVAVTFPATQPVSGSVSVSNFPATQPVSATTLPLPTGAATAANQTPGTAPGTSGTSAMPMQGVTNGVPVSTLDSTDRANDAGTTRQQTHDDTLSAAQAGTGLKVAPAAPAQQTPAGDTSVAVPASASTSVWTTSAAARVLRIVPSNATCFMRSDGGTASNTSTPIPGGYVFNLVEPPPNTNITAFCTTAANVAISQGN